jgi:hypothetical protein
VLLPTWPTPVRRRPHTFFGRLGLDSVFFFGLSLHQAVRANITIPRRITWQADSART